MSDFVLLITYKLKHVLFTYIQKTNKLRKQHYSKRVNLQQERSSEVVQIDIERCVVVASEVKVRVSEDH